MRHFKLFWEVPNPEQNFTECEVRNFGSLVDEDQLNEVFAVSENKIFKYAYTYYYVEVNKTKS